MSAASARPLEGRRIVITRPVAQARALEALVARHGAAPILFPTIEIVGPREAARVQTLIDALETFDIAIFVSPNAAEYGLRAIRKARGVPPHLTVLAVGRGTARALKREGVEVVTTPTGGADSEALLALPQLNDVSGKHIVVFRGEGGRALLGDVLLARGASVAYAECYRRVKPQNDARALIELVAARHVDAFVVTSAEGLRNLCEMLVEVEVAVLAGTPFFVPHPRIAEAARERGLMAVVTGSGDDALLESLCRYFEIAR